MLDRPRGEAAGEDRAAGGESRDTGAHRGRFCGGARRRPL
jgi:hypothetical protein